MELVVIENTVSLISDGLNEDLSAQVIRDLLILSGQWDLRVNADQSLVSDSTLDQLGLERTDADPTIQIVYKIGDAWPQSNLSCPRVKRDLKPAKSADALDTSPHVGYYLRPQGRDSANLTEMYLNRAYPKGKGVVNPMVSLIWG